MTHGGLIIWGILCVLYNNVGCGIRTHIQRISVTLLGTSCDAHAEQIC